MTIDNPFYAAQLVHVPEAATLAAVAAVKTVVDADKALDDVQATASALAALLVPVADTGNSHPVASVDIGATLPGAWTARGVANTLWLSYACAKASAADGLVIEQSDGGVTADESESWTVAEGASGRFPTPLTRMYYRVTYTQGAAAGNVTLAALRDAAVQHGRVRLASYKRTRNGAGLFTDTPIIPGARYFNLDGAHDGTSSYNGIGVVVFPSEDAVTGGPLPGQVYPDYGGPTTMHPIAAASFTEKPTRIQMYTASASATNTAWLSLWA